MFIQIAPRVKVFVSESDMQFIKAHTTGSFRGNELTADDKDRVKRLADKAIFVRKKLTTTTQCNLNKNIRFLYE